MKENDYKTPFDFVTPYRYTVLFEKSGGKVFKYGQELKLPEQTMGIDLLMVSKLTKEELEYIVKGTEYIEELKGDFK